MFFRATSDHQEEGIRYMRRLALKLWKEEAGQDLIEYALLAATVAIAVAGFLPPTIMPAISTIFSKISSTMAAS